MSLLENSALALRLEILAGETDCAIPVFAPVTEFSKTTGMHLANAAREILKTMPPTTDTGRAIAFVDALIHGHGIATLAVSLGAADDARKKRKIAESHPPAEEKK